MSKMEFYLVIVTILILSSLSHAQNISYQGSVLWSGACDVKVQGQYAYCAFFNGLMILDISNPDTPTFVSQFYIGGDWYGFDSREGQRLFISGNYVYFAADYQGLDIIDVSDPANPILVSEFPTITYASDVFVQDNYAYLVCSAIYIPSYIPSSFTILDISDLANPVQVGTCEINGSALGVGVQGNYAYLAVNAGITGFQIIDISNPAAPNLVGHYNIGSTDVVISGDIAYLAGGTNGLVILNVGDPVNPVLVGSWSDPLNVCVYGVYITDSYAYLATDRHFMVVDIHDLANPTLVGSLSAGWNCDVFVVGNRAYVAALTNGLNVINIANPAGPTLAGRYPTPTIVQDIAVSGNYSYAACVASGLNIVDITDPSSPVVVKNWVDTSLYYSPMSVCVSGNYAYLGTYSGVRILNISNPRGPIPLGKCDFPDNNLAKDIFVSEPYVYVADYSQGLFIINISDRLHPVIAGHYSTPYRPYGVYVSGNYAYVADGFTLQILDISNPSNPIFVGSWTDLPGFVVKVYVEGEYAYLADGGDLYNGLQIIDVSDHANPVLTGRFQAHGDAYDVCASGDYAFLAEGWTIRWTQGGVEVIDISDRTNPVLAESLKTPGEGYGIIATGNDIYMADEYSLMILNSNLTGIANDRPFPYSFSLSQNYPNPFNVKTSINYSLSKSGPVNLSIYNLLGQKVATLSDGIERAGEHHVIWDAGNNSSGVYFARLEDAGKVEKIKMILLK